MKNKKSIVDTYYCDVYGFYLVVANKYTTVDQLKKKYIYHDGSELDVDNYMSEGLATTAMCKDKKTNASVCLVKYNRDSDVKTVDKKTDFINTISHEATHVAIYIYYYFLDQKLNADSSEPFCYLQGWAAECIYKTLKK